MRLKPLFWIVLPFIIVAPLLFAGPDLLADTVNDPHWALAPDLHVSKAECRRWEFVVSTCSIRYTGAVHAEITPELHYFVYGTWAGERAVLVRSTQDPAVISTLQAIRDLRARQLTAAVWLAGWLVMGGLAVFAALAKRTVRPRRRVEEPEPESWAQSVVFEPTAAAPVTAAPGGPMPFGRRGR